MALDVMMVPPGMGWMRFPPYDRIRGKLGQIRP
jgi:hypothetical protein